MLLLRDMEATSLLYLSRYASLISYVGRKQLQKCNAMIGASTRRLDRDIAQMKQQEAKAKNLIIQADKRAAREPPQRRAQAQRDVRIFAQELIRCRRTSDRLVTSKAQLNNVQMQGQRGVRGL